MHTRQARLVPGCLSRCLVTGEGPSARKVFQHKGVGFGGGDSVVSGGAVFVLGCESKHL